MERLTRATRAVLTTSATEFAEAAASAIAAGEASGSASLIALRADAADIATDNGTGVAVREQLVELIRRNLRGVDVVSFASADEVLVLLPGTSADEARYVADRLCSAIRNHAFAGLSGERSRVSLTASVGVASAPEHGKDAYLLTGAARKAFWV